MGNLGIMKAKKKNINNPPPKNLTTPPILIVGEKANMREKVNAPPKRMINQGKSGNKPPDGGEKKKLVNV